MRPLDELHRHEADIIVFLDGEDGDDVRVVERGDGLGFPSEARQPVGVSREGIGKNLQRHITIQFRVARAVDLTHATSAEQPPGSRTGRGGCRGEGPTFAADYMRGVSAKVISRGTR